MRFPVRFIWLGSVAPMRLVRTAFIDTTRDWSRPSALPRRKLAAVTNPPAYKSLSEEFADAT